ncbi:hypothetical protein P8935_11680 [Telmatobacter sp. DSM 110680]|uniref:BIG2 domain-containing protein n=1 Tax=Telmatobacter sp. DSM 110680 TaxID=3036704 RepID=A0AAU7DPV9_9BACT
MREAGPCLFRAVVLPTLCTMILLTGCGGSGGSGSTQPPPVQSTITSVTVSPSAPTVQLKATQSFQATVTGTGNYSSSVQWSVGGITGGNAKLGTISSAGVYTAPASPPNPNTVTVTAVSTQDSTKSGSSQTQIGPQPFDITGIQLTPRTATVNTGWSQQFTAVVEGTGSFDTSVSFSVNGVSGGNSTVGSIDSHGLYIAPATLPQSSSVSVTVASVAAPDVSVGAAVTLTQSTSAAPVIKQLVPATADAEQQIQILGSGFNAGGQTTSTTVVVFTGPHGLSIPVELFGGSNNDQERDVAVPLGASDGPIYVIVQDSLGPALKSNTIQFTRTPRIRIRAPQHDLSSGESTTFAWKQLAGAQPITLQWTADKGSVASDGVYTAPSALTSDSFAVVKACVQGTTSCDQERLGLHPFRVSPDTPTVTPGSNLQLQAILGSSMISPTWSSSGPGTLGSGGLYTSSSQFADAGGIPFTATSGAASESGTLQVTGQFPGLVNRISDYFNEQEAHVYGTFPTAIGVANNRLYVNSSYGYYSFALAGDAYPALAYLRDVDVYDISDPSHPIWIDAFEPLTSGKPLYCDGMLYQYAYTEGSYASGSLTVYDISGKSPVPTQHFSLQPSKGHSRNGAASISGCTIAEFGGATGDQRTVSAGLNAPLVLHQLQAGGVVDAQYSIPIPSNSTGIAGFFGFMSDGKRLFVNLVAADGKANLQLLTYDLTASTPTLLDSISTDQLSIDSFQLVGNLLFGTIDTGSYYPRTKVYDVSGNTPQFLTQLPTGYIEGASGTDVFAWTAGTGPRVIDISNPQKPVLKTDLFAYNEGTSDMTNSGHYLFAADSNSGVGVWDARTPGGLLPTELIPDDYENAVPTGIISNASDLFVASDTIGGGSLARFDLKQSPPAQTSQVFQSNVAPSSLALSGSTLYEGTATSLGVFDVSASGDPTSITSIDMPVAALAVTGTTLLAGTFDNHLIVYNISQPQSPKQIASVSLAAAPYQIVISGNLAIIADDTGGLLTYNISNPSTPTLLSKVTLFPEVFGVAIDGNLALLAAREYGLVILDISNPAAPSLLGRAAVDTVDPFTTYPLMYNKAFAIAVKNQIAWIGIHNLDDDPDAPSEGGSEVMGFDYRDPSHPRLVSRNSYGPSYTFVWTLADSPAGLICGCSSSLLALDTTQPLNTIGSFELPEPLRSSQKASSVSPSLSARSVASPAAGRVRSDLSTRLRQLHLQSHTGANALPPDRSSGETPLAKN